MKLVLGLHWACLFLSVCNSWQYAPSHNPKRGVNILHQWKHLEYDYATENDRQAAINSGEFVPNQAFPIDTDIIYTANNSRKIFITSPRFLTGVPASLGVVTDKTYEGNPVIAPFPSWRWHQNFAACNEDRIVSVFRVKIDECGRVWLFDNGHLGDKQVCPAQILAFDALTSELLYRHEVPQELLESISLLVTINVDVRDSTCSDTFIYGADCQRSGLIVHDVSKGTTWKVIDKTMYPHPTEGTFNILGDQFEVMDGILGMDLSPYKPGEDRILFFHALTSITENWVYTSYIRNHSRFIDNPNSSPQIFNTYPGRRRSQVPAEAIDRNGIAFFGEASDTSLSCWNTNTPYGGRNIDVLYRNTETMQFPSGIKVITNNVGDQEILFITMRFQKIATGSLNINEVNFRIQIGNIRELTSGSRCTYGINQENHVTGHHHYHHHHKPSHGGGYGFGGNGGVKNTSNLRPIYFPDH